MDFSPFQEHELGEVGAILAWAFGVAGGDEEPWVRRAGLENVRVVRREGRVKACLVVIPMGQFFGGRRVPMVGVAGVATPAESRGSGDAIALMKRALLELRESGVALSALYPATLGLYRRVGYECAGTRYEARVAINAIGLVESSVPLRPMVDGDRAEVEALYLAHAKRTNGHLDRGSYVWDRVRNPRGADATKSFVVGESGRIDGYTFLHQRRIAPGRYDLFASDLVASTPAAHRKLLALVAGQGTLGESFSWSGAPNDPFVHVLPRAGTQIRVVDPWMLRIVDLPAALRARGWPDHVVANLELEVADDVLEENAGRWTVHVAGGSAEVKRGGRGSIRIDVRALAALYSGFLEPHALMASGGLEVEEAELDRLATAFAFSRDGAPWMPDMF